MFNLLDNSLTADDSGFESWGITVVKFRPKVDRQTLTKENFLSNETTVSRFVHDLESRTRAFRNSASACVSNVNDTVFHGNWTEAILTVLRLENHLNAICGLKSVLGPQIKIPPTPGAVSLLISFSTIALILDHRRHL